jgi:hypothetical protein
MSIKISLTIVLFVVFVILKLTHTIAWSWLWVTAPLWGTFALAIVVFVVAFLLLAVAEACK